MTEHISPLFAAAAPGGNAITFAWKHLTPEGLSTVIALLIVSVFSWTVIITKARQLIRASRMGKKFFAAYRATRDPMDIFRSKEEFEGAPAYELYAAGAEEVAYHLKNNPVQVQRLQSLGGGNDGQALGGVTDVVARSITTKISAVSFDSVRVALERAATAEAMSLEKGMIILSTAVAGGPFIGLFGTVWGVMETFSGIGRAGAASLTAMAPGVAAALLATVAGLTVAIPAMFGYNYMVTTIRGITQELDGFASEYATQLEHKYVDTRPLAEEIRDALMARAETAPALPALPPVPAITSSSRKADATPAPAFAR
jgi:biopolymer transport protein TolQ